MAPEINGALSQQVDAAIAEYLNAVKRGEPPTREEYISQHPEIAAELEQFLADHHALDGAARAIAAPASTDNAANSTGHAALFIRPSLTSPQRFGNFELIEEIARGGMGVVYKARQSTPSRIVALKMILSGQLASRADVDRFYAEAHAAAALDHPNIVPVFEVGEHGGQHYFTMAFVEGQSLGQRLANGPMPAREAAQIARDVALAVEHAHQHRIIHRDLKPSNVLIDSDGRVRVTDFGLAKRLADASGLTYTGELLGTPSFMSPEQVSGDPTQIGPASDVYSLGATMYALVTGRSPFQAASTVETLHQVVDQEPVPPRQLNANIPRDFETIILKCLEKSRDRRYATAEALAGDLERYLSDRPIEARPPSAAYRFRKFSRRNQGLIAAAALVVATLLGGTAISWRQAVRAIHAEEQATANEHTAVAKARQATEVSKFLGNMLASANPYREGRRITVEEVLDRGASELDKSFADDPVTKAALLQAIGDSYRGLSNHSKARSLLNQAVEIRSRELGPENRDTLTSMATLVLASPVEVAVPLAEKTLERRKATLGPDHPETLDSMGLLGHEYFCAGRYAEAVSLLEETLKRQTVILGRDNLDTAGTMVNLAGIYAMQQRHEPAIRLDQEVLGLPCAKQNPDDPTVLAATRDLATVYWYSGRQDDARAIWEEVLPRQRDRWGSAHPMTLITIKNLAMEYRRQGRFPDAVSCFKELYDTLKTKYGAKDTETLNALLELAKTYLAAGRLDDATTQIKILLEAQPKNAAALKIRDQVQDKLQTQSTQTESSK